MLLTASDAQWQDCQEASCFAAAALTACRCCFSSTCAWRVLIFIVDIGSFLRYLQLQGTASSVMWSMMHMEQQRMHDYI